MYQPRYNSLCILHYVLTQIQLSLYSKPDKTLSVLSSMYQSIYNFLSILQYVSTQIQLPLYSNPDTTLSVLSSMYRYIYNSLCILKYVSILIKFSIFSSMNRSRYNPLYSKVCSGFQDMGIINIFITYIISLLHVFPGT